MEPRSSSFGAAFRAFVMLACLVALPLLALGTSVLPKTLRDLVGAHWPAAKTAEQRPLNAEPQFAPVPPSSGHPAAPLEQRMPLRAADPLPAAPNWPDSPAGYSSPVTPAAFEMPIAPAASPLPVATRDPFGDLQPRPMMPSAEAPRALEPMPIAAQPVSLASPGQENQLTVLQDRLRQQGATYFLLESWGSQQQLYRFFCKMAIGGNPNCTRHFEATNADPLQAMSAVVQQVDEWRSGGL